MGRAYSIFMGKWEPVFTEEFAKPIPSHLDFALQLAKRAP
jgi:hypothetical protein